MVDGKWLVVNCGLFFSRKPAPTELRSGSGGGYRRLSTTCITWIIGIGLVGLLIVAAWFRCRSLENIPGLNGDETWYGVKAVEILQGTPTAWLTPTGNPLNPFFLGPLILLHWWFEPSIILLRSVAVASGLLALLLNWVLCRWVYDRQTAWISTAVLAVLPIDIAYSRFAWDASQSLAATLPVLYFALAAVRFPQWKTRLIAAAIVCQVIAVLVHPTNVFAATAIAAALAARWKLGDLTSLIRGLLKRPFVTIAIATFCLAIGICIIWLVCKSIPRLLEQCSEALLNSDDILKASIFYPRLFVGGTIYSYIAGSHSWFEWPLSFVREGFGIDVLAFWLLILVAGIILWRSWISTSRKEDGVLLAAWILEMAGFLLFGVSRAMITGYERFAICLIAPTAVLFCRAFTLTLSRNSPGDRTNFRVKKKRTVPFSAKTVPVSSKISTATSPARQVLLLTALLVGWFMLADFYVHYFRFIENTGGQAHLTFRTAMEEPKAAALKFIMEHRKPGKTLIVVDEWWNFWPLKYLSMNEGDLCVLTPEEAAKQGDIFYAMQKEDRVWFVVFSTAEVLLKNRAESAKVGLDSHEIKDYGDRPILTVLHVRD
jgi:hypothetical protein